MKSVSSKIKFFAGFLCIFLCTSLFTSCIDYVQTLTYSDGKYQIFMKCTVSKALCSLADMDADDFSREFKDMEEEFSGDDEKSVVVDTDLETGIQMSMNIPSDTTDSDLKKFIPVTEKNVVKMPFYLGNAQGELSDSMNTSDSTDESKAVALAILSTAKCRVMISKKFVPVISKAYFEGDEDNLSVDLYDYGESYCVEVPLVLMLVDDADDYDFTNIVLVK